MLAIERVELAMAHAKPSSRHDQCTSRRAKRSIVHRELARGRRDAFGVREQCAGEGREVFTTRRMRAGGATQDVARVEMCSRRLITSITDSITTFVSPAMVIGRHRVAIRQATVTSAKHVAGSRRPAVPTASRGAVVIRAAEAWRGRAATAAGQMMVVSRLRQAIAGRRRTARSRAMVVRRRVGVIGSEGIVVASQVSTAASHARTVGRSITVIARVAMAVAASLRIARRPAIVARGQEAVVASYPAAITRRATAITDDVEVLTGCVMVTGGCVMLIMGRAIVFTCRGTIERRPPTIARDPIVHVGCRTQASHSPFASSTDSPTTCLKDHRPDPSLSACSRHVR